jgi:hypothetical protein
MQKTLISALAATLALSVSGAAVAPAIAAPAAQSAQLVQVADYHHRGFYMHDHYYYYNGYRGDRHRHHGWREYRGYWFPPSAFIGAAIGGIIGNAIAHSH